VSTLAEGLVWVCGENEFSKFHSDLGFIFEWCSLYRQGGKRLLHKYTKKNPDFLSGLGEDTRIFIKEYFKFPVEKYAVKTEKGDGFMWINVAEDIREEGEERNRTKVILRMYSRDYPVSEIADITSLSEDEVRGILKKNGIEENLLDSFFSENKPEGIHQFGKD